MKMFPLKSSGPRSTLEEMLDLFRTNDTEKESSGDRGEETMPPPLPVRPTSRARLPSSVRVKKQQNVGVVMVAPTSKSSVNVIKEDSAVDRLVANVEAPVDRFALKTDGDRVSTPVDLLPSPSGRFPALSVTGDQTPRNGHMVLETRLSLPSSTYESKLEQSEPPLIGPGVVLIERSDVDSGNWFDDSSEKANGSVAHEEDEPVQSGLFVLRPQQLPFVQIPTLQTLPLTPPATPPPELSSPLPGNKKWKDDGVLRLRKVQVLAQAFLIIPS